MFSSREARLIDERARKNAEMAPFNLNNWLPLVDTVWNSVLLFDESKMVKIHKLINVVNNTEGGIRNVTLDMVR